MGKHCEAAHGTDGETEAQRVETGSKVGCLNYLGDWGLGAGGQGQPMGDSLGLAGHGLRIQCLS